ncbi:MAG: FAD:protein FMN transferase [Eubacteriales bacterium]|nr:FAD:protein FMN transferase [Eubacteriales bacterium]
MQKKFLAFITALVFLLTLSACSSKMRKEYSFSGQFDSFTSLIVESEDFNSADLKFFEARLNYYHQLFTPYEDFPELMNLATINKLAKTERVDLPVPIKAVLDLSLEAEQKSNGAFSPTLGSAILFWREVKAAAEAGKLEALPVPADLASLLPACASSNLDYDGSGVHFKNPTLALDLGGVAKGYAVERLVIELAERGLDNLLLSVGGNVRALGTKLSGEKWRILIQDPFKGSKLNFPKLVVEIADEALVTSGLYERYFYFDNQRYSHILDPETLWPQDQYISISVLGKDSGICDLLATTLFNLDIETGKKLAAAYEVEVLWISPRGDIELTPGFEKRLITHQTK